jgi:TolB-like protein/DNA-binding winged helix-turn-helix (wHTH) protein
MRFAFGEFELAADARTLEKGGQRIWIEPKVFDLLVYLIEHRERFVSSDELVGAVWSGVNVGPAAVSQAIHKARRAVGDDGGHQEVLRTEHGHGYRFVAKVLSMSTPTGVAPESTGSRVQLIVAAGIATLLLGVSAAWFLKHSAGEVAPTLSLAVLPFVNMSGGPNQTYLADGITDELLHALVEIEGLRVVGRTSSYSFKNSDADLVIIGKALGVDLIVEGSVRMTNDQVRVTVQLVDAEDGFHLWSESYNREIGDALTIQQEIARSIVNALRVELSR